MKVHLEFAGGPMYLKLQGWYLLVIEHGRLKRAIAVPLDIPRDELERILYEELPMEAQR